MTEKSLDPADWEAFRRDAHAAMDLMVDYLRDVRERPVWQPLPDDVLARLSHQLAAATRDDIVGRGRTQHLPQA